MKRIVLFAIVFCLTIISCKKKDDASNTSQESKAFAVKSEATTVRWTAYKTTAKKPVSGTFSSLDFDSKYGASPIEALNGLNFSIPVRSLFSNDKVRDQKLKESFFGAMINPKLLKGSLQFDANNNCVATVEMNGVSRKLPMTYTLQDNRRVTLKGTMNLEDWLALPAIASLNTVCFDLHKGEDGISKTWTDVAIEVSIYLRKES